MKYGRHKKKNGNWDKTMVPCKSETSGQSITLMAINSCISTAFSRSSFCASHASSLGSHVNGSRWTLSRSTMVNLMTDRSFLSWTRCCLSFDSSDLDHDISSLLAVLLTELHNILLVQVTINFLTDDFLKLTII